MTLAIDLQVLVLRGHALGYLGVIKATLPDDYYGVYVPGLGNHTLHQSSLMPLNEFKAMRDDLATAQTRIAELEAVIDKLEHLCIAYMSEMTRGTDEQLLVRIRSWVNGHASPA